MKNHLKRLLFLAIFLAVLIIPYLVFAQESGSSEAAKNMTIVADKGGFQTADVDETTISTIAGRVVATILGLLGVLFISLMIYGGGLWMTAQGNEDQVEKSKKILKNSIIGLILIVSSWAIYNVVENFLF